MPKQIYKIDNFHGGLNTNADPRDIADNEFPSATDVMVDELGTLRTLGGTTAHPSETGAGSVSHANEITPGYGLFPWKADRKLSHVAIADYHGTHTGSDHSTVMTDSSATFPINALVGATIQNTTDGSSGVITANTSTTVTVGSLTGGTDNSWDDADNDAYKITDIPTTGESYLAFSDSDATGTVKLYAMGSDTWGAPIANRNDISGGTRKDVFYAVDGALRVCDGIFENDNTSKFHGYTDTTFLSSLSGDEVVRDYWTTQSQYISTPSENSSFDQAIATTGLTASSIEKRTSTEVDAADNDNSDAAINTTTAGIFDLDTDSNGRWSVERFKGLMFQVERDANVIAQRTRRGKGNIIICSSDVASALQMAGVLDYTPALNNNLNVDDTGNTFAGVLNGKYRVYIDPYAANLASNASPAKQYYVVGYKGTSPYDAGIFYCPYVPLQMVRAVGQDSFQPKIGFKTRYGLVANPFAGSDVTGTGSITADGLTALSSNRYYRRVQVTNIM